jgi:polar amino acid transport system substrate-binding protein
MHFTSHAHRKHNSDCRRFKGKALAATDRLIIASLVVLIGGCAGMQPPPRPDAGRTVARTGKLRVAFLATAPTHAIKDPVSGELKGPAVDLGKEMARRLGVQFEAHPYTSLVPVLSGAKAGDWDVAMMGISREREKYVDFTAPYMIVEFGSLVRSGLSISNFEDLDRLGIRIAVLDKSSPDSYLSRMLQNATLIRLPTLAAVVQALSDGKVDAIYATRATVVAQSAKVPGSRVLEGELGGEETAIAIPKGRNVALAHARRFVEAVKAEGFVKAVLDKANLRGVIVAPKWHLLPAASDLSTVCLVHAEREAHDKNRAPTFAENALIALSARTREVISTALSPALPWSASCAADRADT